ncbi:AAA+ ATPase [Helicosporidium sp. ATCC 50920]|nr:AAA+ ATPase [Helicosporidium sp. ATCC 50920]|eukprot:KDD76727.1 AAA+ ATPase [Helicosporidium sp. ATCC 50920]
MLNVQYRMHAAIMEWSSKTLYDGRLRAHESCQSRSLEQVLGRDGLEARGREVEAASAAADSKPDKAKRKPEKKNRGAAGAARAAKVSAAPPAAPGLSLASCPCLSPSTALLLIDTAGCEMEEAATADQGSKSNAREAEVAMTHVRRLHAMGLGLDQIGIITPYAAQVSLLRDLRRALFGEQAALEVSTVDGFQGREKEAIVISAVRSNDKRSVGFLNDARRMNVAVTRARCHCALVGDSETLKTDPFLNKLVEYFEQEGEQESACLLVDA